MQFHQSTFSYLILIRLSNFPTTQRTGSLINCLFAKIPLIWLNVVPFSYCSFSIEKIYIYIYYSIVHSVFFQFRVDSLLTNSELICNKQNCTLTKYKSELCICRFFFLVEHSFFIGVMHCDAQCRLGWRTSLFEGLLLLRTATLFANSHTDDEMNGKM